jgi:hypothetical protein
MIAKPEKTNGIAKIIATDSILKIDFNIPYNAELIHEVNKTIWGLKTTTKMDIHEFCDYTTKVTQFWQERTQGEFIPKELPESYLIKKGYDLEYNLR